MVVESDGVYGEGEYTFVMFKPDTLERDLFNDVLSYFKSEGLQIPAMTRKTVSHNLIDQHYSHVPDNIRETLHEYIGGEDVVAAVIYGQNAIERTREIVGDDWRPENNPFGTIRGDIHNPESALFWRNNTGEEISKFERRYDSNKAGDDEPVYNLIHAVDPTEENPDEIARQEVKRFFDKTIWHHLEG